MRRHVRQLQLLALFCALIPATIAFPLSRADAAAGSRTAAAHWSSLVSHAGRAALRRSPFNQAAWPTRAFSAASFWNRPLSSDAPLDRRSAAYVHELIRQVKAYGPWLNSTSYSVPVYVVGPHAETQRVTLDTWGPDLQQAFDAVPVPQRAQAAAGTDESMTVWQPSRDRLWDFWQIHRVDGHWHARWGGEMDDVSQNPGFFQHSGQTNDWGATATGLPLLGGLITFKDLERGWIDHALTMSLVETEPADFSWPAQRTDGYVFSKTRTEIPEGMRFRLNPRVDIDRLGLPPIDRMLARAAQRYGIVVGDKAGAVAFYGQDPVDVPDPWPAAFEDQMPGQVLQAFPWQDLETIRPQMSCCWSH